MGFIPKSAQLRFALALDTGEDVTCVAATGFGKSLVFQMAAILMQERNECGREKLKQFGICIAAIEALGEDQVDKCAVIGLQAVNLTDRTISLKPAIISDILKRAFDLGISLLYYFTEFC